MLIVKWLKTCWRACEYLPVPVSDVRVCMFVVNQGISCGFWKILQIWQKSEICNLMQLLRHLINDLKWEMFFNCLHLTLKEYRVR